MEPEEYEFQCNVCQRMLIRAVISRPTLNKQTVRVTCPCGDYDEQVLVGTFAFENLETQVVDVTYDEGFVLVETV